MKRTHAAFCLVTCLMTGHMVLAQGPLLPPGPPGKTMKSLDQVEPRTPVDNNTTLIRDPGSYYLTENIGDTVIIDSDQVTLDLMGFTITAGTAIQVTDSVRNLVIRNGMLVADGYGVDFRNSPANANTRIEDLVIEGGETAGIAVGGGCLIQRCKLAGVNEGQGIQVADNSRVRDCEVTGYDIGLQTTGRGALIENNRVLRNNLNYDFTPENQLNLLLCEIPEDIRWSSSVTLAGSLESSDTTTNGITILADNVSIDLAGHTLTGPGVTGSSINGIYQPHAYRNASVRNGIVRNWRGTGVSLLGKNNLVEHMLLYTNRSGVLLNYGGSIINCHAYGNVEYGLYGGYGVTIANSTAYGTELYGIATTSAGTIIGCTAADGAVGIYASDSTIVRDSTIVGNGSGIFLSDSCALINCIVSGNTNWGVYANNRSFIAQNTVTKNKNASSTGVGIEITGTDNRIEDNNVVDNNTGIKVNAAGNFVVRNTASGNSANWNMVAGNACLVVQATTASAFTGNSGGVSPGSTDPNANFTY